MQQFNCFFVNNDRMQVNRPLCNNLIAPPRCMFCSFIEWSRTCKKPRDRCTQCPCAFYFSFQTKLDPISRKMRCTLFFCARTNAHKMVMPILYSQNLQFLTLQIIQRETPENILETPENRYTVIETPENVQYIRMQKKGQLEVMIKSRCTIMLHVSIVILQENNQLYNKLGCTIEARMPTRLKYFSHSRCTGYYVQKNLKSNHYTYISIHYKKS